MTFCCRMFHLVLAERSLTVTLQKDTWIPRSLWFVFHTTPIVKGFEISLVESDYTVVFFAAGGKYTPGWNWVWKAYRSLSRKYRKNLKRLVCMSFLPFMS